jgi:hypothetical protein
MHELQVTQSILEIILAYAQQNNVERVLRVHLTIGALNDFQGEWIQRYFDYLRWRKCLPGTGQGVLHPGYGGGVNGQCQADRDKGAVLADNRKLTGQLRSRLTDSGTFLPFEHPYHQRSLAVGRDAFSLVPRRPFVDQPLHDHCIQDLLHFLGRTPFRQALGQPLLYPKECSSGLSESKTCTGVLEVRFHYFEHLLPVAPHLLSDNGIG